MNELGFRNSWISLAIGLSIGTVGLVILRDTEEAKAAFAMVILALTIALRHVLDGRELRRRGIERPKRQRG